MLNDNIGRVMRADVFGYIRNMRWFRSSCVNAKYHPGLCSSFIHSVISNDFVSGRWRSWSDSAHAQTDLGICCPHMPEDTFSHGLTPTILVPHFRHQIQTLVKARHEIVYLYKDHCQIDRHITVWNICPKSWMRWRNLDWPLNIF